MKIRNTLAALLVMVMAMAMATTSCVKEEDYLTDPSARLAFSCDTVSFDTVLATMGTTTQQLRVYNRNDKPMLIKSIRLKKGYESRFRINVDGDTSMVVKEVELPAGDSLFVFVQANINPNASTEPFLIEDAIEFAYNDVRQEVVLEAYGRNAVYHTPNMNLTDQYGNIIGRCSMIDCEGWDHTQPHVIMGYAMVDGGKTLQLNAGETLYMADNASLLVLEGGTLKIRGTREQPVVITSVRHDGWYDTLPGQWYSVWLSGGSIDNEIDHALIENGTIGLMADTNVNGNPTLSITNSTVRNHSMHAIRGNGSYIEGDNLLLCNTGSAVLALQNGGRYRFSNSTVADDWRFDSRTVPAIAISNYYEDNISGAWRTYVRDLQLCEFRNCIISGSRSLASGGELLLAREESGEFNLRFDHCLVKSSEVMPYAESSQVCEDPRYVNTRACDYHLREDSPAIGAGSQAYVTIAADLDGVPRAVPPTIGAYEYAPQTTDKTALYKR